MGNLIEDRRSQLISRGRSAQREKDGKTRYQKRVKSRISKSTREFNQLDMNKLFKQGILDINIPVHGETDDYVVSISFGGFLDDLERQLKTNRNVLDLRIIIRALINSFNGDNVYLRCNCLHPDTEILLLDGTKARIEDLCSRFNNGEQLYVYSTDDKGDFKPGVVRNVWKSGSSSELVRITLDNESTIQMTLDHRVMLRNGSYIAAKDLQPGQSLMPMYFSDCNGYQTVKFNSTGKYHSVYKQVAAELLADEIAAAEAREIVADKRGPYKVAIHHKDFNKRNNIPSNLEPLTWEEHWMYHASLGFNSFSKEVQDKIRAKSSEWLHWLNAHPTERMLQQRREYCERGRLMNYLPERREQQSHVMRDAITTYWRTMSDEERARQSKARSERSTAAAARGCLKTEKFRTAALKRGKDMHTPEREALITEGVRRYWNSLEGSAREARINICRRNIQKSIDARRGTPLTKEHRDKIRASRERETPEQLAIRARKCSETKILTVLNYLIDNGLDLTLDNYNDARKYKFKSYPFIERRFSSIDDAVSYFKLNHKVVKVEFIHLDVPVDVYDIDVDNWHNFTTAAGVVLHNCSDFRFRQSYWMSRDDVILGQKETIPSRITNPNNTLGPGCKHIMLVLSNHNWIIKIASVIMNYIKYIEVHKPSLYADIVYPAIYGKKYEGPVQTSFLDDDNKLADKESGKDDLDQSNIEARKRGQFTAGNEYRFRPSTTSPGQLSIPEEDSEDV